MAMGFPFSERGKFKRKDGKENITIAHVFVLPRHLSRILETLRTERIFARTFAGKFEKSELSLESWDGTRKFLNQI